MTEACVDAPEGVLSPHQTFTLPRYNMSDVLNRMNARDSQKSATLAKMEGNTDLNSDLPKLRRRPSMRGFSNFIDRMVRTVTTLPRDKHSRKYDGSRVDEACDYIQYGTDEVPGVVGLSNHGNTCFINAVLQCLSNTDVLAEYFVTGQYRADLCRRTRANAKKFGTKGEVTEQLAVTLKSIWSRQYNSEVSSQFKVYVEKYGSHFRGNEQHDAQEFLMWLLDKVHEDLNTATKKKYRKIKGSLGRPDEVVAAETLANHLRCNASFVQDIFQAQFRSSLRCPNCRKESNTFDPFLCVSVPILQRQIRPLIATLVYANQQPRQVRMGFSVESGSSVADFKSVIGADTGLDPDRLLLCQLDDTGFTQTLQDADAVWTIGDTERLYCIELPPASRVCDEDAPVTLVWANLCLSESGVPHWFGSPYVMQVSRDVLYEDLQKLMLKEMAAVVKPDVLSSAQEVPLFTVRVVDGVPVDHTVQHPLFTEPVEEALSASVGPPHVTLLLEWEQDAIDSVLASTEDCVEEHRTVREVARHSLSPVTLQECLQLYTKSERLGPEDSWRCPGCQSSQQAEKRLSLWSIPDILVIHLKRFRQTNNQRSTSKLTTLVEFPLQRLDMSQHLSHRPSGADSAPGALSLLSGWSPWKRRQRGGAAAARAGEVYELYAVCNHHGKDLQSGHYTALCRNATDGNWYRYDDSRVQRVEEAAVVSPDAYILFYQRQTLRNCAAEATPESGDHPRHWAYRIPVRAAGDAAPAPAAAPAAAAPAPAGAVGGVSEGEAAADTTATESSEPAEPAAAATDEAADSSPAAPAAAAVQGSPTRLSRGGVYSTLPAGGGALRPPQADHPCSDDEAPLASEETVELEGALTPQLRPRHASGGGPVTSPAGAVTSPLAALTNGQAAGRGRSPSRRSVDMDERMPSRPQVIVIGRNSSEPTTNGDAAHFGDKIQIFVRQADDSAPAGDAAKLKCTPPVTDGATALTNGHRAPEESRL
ncbi:ubiquitin carboxyl-terminal hydrolase 31-like isoform X1 [Amphibalanus amphitrite]|uniref:ubiquitin carboxyl-terminal hydrolase 31-like isoform X1 n=1 Tax=Amphibalanus amphitrite TaxID=1232801 RepID=UPI001C92553A|nr:ubiquitin carboxyl-terminal hydrolase 31-like isoform X1 [Amphibalanus amphitrite]